MRNRGPSHFLKRFLYRRYRKLKRHALENPHSWGARFLFRVFEQARARLGTTTPAPRDPVAVDAWKSTYSLRHGDTSPFRVECHRALAVDSDDNKWPRGAVYDNSTNREFNLKLYAFFDHKPDLRVMDLGCAGGGFVRSILEDGFAAVGIEGAEDPKRLRLCEWDTIPRHLFNADITHPFRVLDAASGDPIRFDCITAWEVLEHIPEDRLPVLLDNIVRHLTSTGIFVGSIDRYPDGDPFTGAVYHVTLRDEAWWLERFARVGLVPVRERPFEVEDFVRGHGMGIKDWDPRDGGGFHVVLSRREPRGEGP